MGFRSQFALHQTLAADVRYGSKADIEPRLMSALPPKADIRWTLGDVRKVPKGHSGRFSILLLVGNGAQVRGASPVKLLRRKFLHLAAGAAALPAVSRIAQAQTYPSRPVRILVGFPPGSAPDIVARLLGQQLSDRLGQPFVIDNRPGASSNIATEAVVHAAPDGYTLLVVSLANVFNATLYDKLNFNLIRDIVPVASIHREPFLVEVNPSVPVKTVPEFIAYAKLNSGKINLASGGIGSGNHIFGELFKMMTGVNLVHVPYRGAGPALVDLLGGQVQVMFASMSSTIEYVRAGKLRALAVTT